MTSKDPYEVLGIKHGISPDEIKKAYKKLAAEVHPDKPDGDAAKFIEITNAFKSIISDLPNQSPTFTINSDETVELYLTLEEMVFGCSKNVKAKIISSTCWSCGGTGADDGSPKMPCISCLGTGRAPNPWKFSGVNYTCVSCKGTGFTPAKICKTCNGKGTAEGEINVQIQIPAGVDSGQNLKFSSTAGDLFVRICGVQHAIFKRQGNDLITQHRISFIEAIRGATMSVPNLNGNLVDITIPAGSQPDDRVRAVGSGVRDSQSGYIGDLIVELKIEIPRKLTPRANKLIEELADEIK